MHWTVWAGVIGLWAFSLWCNTASGVAYRRGDHARAQLLATDSVFLVVGAVLIVVLTIAA